MIIQILIQNAVLITIRETLKTESQNVRNINVLIIYLTYKLNKHPTVIKQRISVLPYDVCVLIATCFGPLDHHQWTELEYIIARDGRFLYLFVYVNYLYT